MICLELKLNYLILLSNIFLYISAILVHIKGSSLNEQELISKIFQDYNPAGRPVRRMSQPLAITLYAKLRKVEMVVGTLSNEWFLVTSRTIL